MTNLGGLFVPLITPFGPDGQVDATALGELAGRALDAGAAGLVALGTTAETATLTTAERYQVLDVCAAVCRSRGAPLIAGAGSNDTRGSAEALAALASWPEIRAALTVVPYYSRPGELGVLEHFRVLAQAGPVPLIIYNVPYRTGQPIGWDTMRQLAALPGVAGVKHAAGAVDQDTVIMMASRPDGFAVLAGDDLFASAMLALGASGAIMASAHVCTRGFAALISAWRDGRADEARQLGHKLTRLSSALFAEPNPAVIKAVLHRRGEIPTAAVRLPLLPAGAAAADQAMAAAADLGE
jgi:4-hydroxy-tetrahydrodipicolinate synthase